MKKYVFCCLILMLLISVSFAQHVKAEVIGLAKSDMESLFNNDADILFYIDWEFFTAFGHDYGAEFTNITDKQEKDEFQKEVLREVSGKLNQSGKNVFMNWNMTDNDDGSITVTAENDSYSLKMGYFSPDDMELYLSSVELVPAVKQ